MKTYVKPKLHKIIRKVTKKPLIPVVASFVLIFAGIGTYTILRSSAAATCNLSATPSNFASQVTAASTGQTLCLASGNYNIFNGTNKAINIIAADGASPQMTVNFSTGANGFTLDGMTGMGGVINGSASNITIKNSQFASNITITGPSINAIVLDGNKHNFPFVSYTGGPNAKINIEKPSGTLASPDVTIKNSEIANGDLDGIHIGGDNNSGVRIENNYLHDLCDLQVNHTDNIQWDDIDPGATETIVSGNYIYAPSGCGTQGITSFDAGTGRVIIENNVVDIPRAGGIEIYGDNNGGAGGSIVRHNTLVYRPTPCLGDGGKGCGQIVTDSRAGDPLGNGTQIYDNNVTTIQLGGGTTATQHHNICRAGGCTGTGTINSQVPSFLGPSNTHDGYLLATGSIGRNAASDGTDIGVYSTSGVVTCDINVSTGAALDSAVNNTNNSGKTICVTANITGNHDWTARHTAMVRVVAQPNNMTIDMGGIDVGGANNITIEGFEFTNGGMGAGGGSSNIKIIKNYFHDMPTDALRTSGATTNLEFSGNNVKCIEWTNVWTDGYGIRFIGGPNNGFKANYNTIDGCDNSADGMEVGDMHGFEIIGNEIKNIRYVGGSLPDPHADAIMIWQNSDNGIVKDNRITDSDDILLNNSTNVLIENNLIVRMYNTCQIGGPAGDSDNTLRNHTWRQNTVYQCGKYWNSGCISGMDGWGTNPPTTSCGYGLNSSGPLAGGIPPSGNTLDRNLLVDFGGPCSQFSTAPNHNLVRTSFSCSGTNQGNFTPTFQNTIDWLPTNLPAGYADVGYRVAPYGYTAYGGGQSTPSPQTPADSTPPTVSMTAPTNGATVSGNSVTISANASDNAGVAGVQFKIDGNNINSEDTSSPYSTSWNSLGVANGTHTLTAVARDTSGNTTTSNSVSITVTNTGNFTIGETSTGTSDDNGNANLLLTQQVTLSQTATIQSLSFYVTNAAGKLRLGIYDATGPSGGPGAKKAETAEMTPAVGWNTANVTSSVSLPAGTYWLAYAPSDNNLAFRIDRSKGTHTVVSSAYGVMPATHPSTGVTTSTGLWSFYATFSLGGSPAPSKTGDVNSDGQVNIFDLSILLSNYGKTKAQASNPNSDINNDNIVNIFDLSILLSNYGK